MIELAAFLGNPGKEYSRNRHNAGFLLAEKLCFYNDLSWQKKFKGLYSAMDGNRLAGYPSAVPLPRDASSEGEAVPNEILPPKTARGETASRLHFIMPQTYMNLSGEPVHQAASFFKIKPESILVVHDELELPLGTISLKWGGGLGGHNGLRSMKACFATADFWRIRIGIGRPDSRAPGEGGPPGSGEGIVDWVLSDFSPPEREILECALEAGAALFLRAISEDPQNLLKEWAKKKIQ